MTGKLIVIEGLDGSGKATQSELLYRYLLSKGESVMKRSFPNYESNSSTLVRMYLQGEFGSRPEDVNAYAASSFYAVDRFADYKKYWQDFYLCGGLVVADRYTTSNAVHQCSKLPEREWDGFINWLCEYEYRLLGIPAPTLTIYLQMDPTVSRQLMDQRCAKEHRQKDIHELDEDYLCRSRAAADYCAGKLNWHIVDGCRKGALRTVEEVQQEITAIVEHVVCRS